MSLGCAKCGDCCEDLCLDTRHVDEGNRWWLYWQRGGKKNTRTRQGMWPDIRFITSHWTEVRRTGGQSVMRCDQFDTETRTCMAYEDRPPVCRDYPWYSDAGDAERIRKRAPQIARRCSFLLDVAPEDRGPDARPLIPLTVL